MSDETAPRRTFASLSTRNFRLYFIGQLISISGTWMQSAAQGWLVLSISHDNVLDLSIVTALAWTPMLLFGSFGGLMVDRLNKRSILYVTQSSAGVLAAVLGTMDLTHHVTVHAIYLIATCLGVINLFDNPARQAFVQEMVGRDQVANAVSLNSVLMNAGRAVGPALAGPLIHYFSIAACFYFNAGSFAAVLIALAMMRSHELYPLRRVERAKRQLREGFAYVVQVPLLRTVLISTFVVGTFAFNFTVTLPVLARRTFGEHHATGYTMLLTAMGVGAVLGGLYVARRSRPTIELLAGLALCFGVAMTAAGLAPSLLWATIMMVPTGAASIAFVSTANALLQLNSRDVMRGRVMSLYAIGFLGTTPIGALVIGAIIDASNPRVGIVVGSSLTVLTGVWLILLARSRAVRAALTTESSPAQAF